MEIRQKKETDQENIDKALAILGECIKLNSQIEPTLWLSAFVETIIFTYVTSGFSYHEFEIELEKIKIHFKPHFDH